MINKLQTTLFLFCVICIGHLSAQITGTKTIATAGDFTSFTEVITALNTQGISGDVIFEVEDGIYTEQLSIDGTVISGISTGSITFNGKDQSTTTLTYNANTTLDNYTLQLKNVENITFQNLTISNNSPSQSSVLDGSNVQNLSFTNCHFLGEVATSPIANNTLMYIENTSTNIQISSCLFENGNFGVTLIDAANSGIVNSTFTNQYRQSLSIGDAKSFHFEGNSVTNESTAFANYYGIELWSCYDFDVKQNTFLLKNGQTALFFNGDDVIDSTALNVSNNYIQIESVSNTTNGAFWLSTNTVNFYHNTIRVIKGDKCLFFVSGFSNNILNNNFINQGEFEVYGGNGLIAGNKADYNNLYSNGSISPFGKTFTEHKAGSGLDSNSFNYFTPFNQVNKPDICHYGLNKKGITTTINKDYYNLNRESLADIGAFEFAVPTTDIVNVTDTTLCKNDTLLLDAGTGYSSYSWTSGGNSQIEKITQGNGYVYLEVVDVNLCTLVDSIQIFLDDAQVDLGKDTLICQGTSTELIVSNQFLEIEWSTGITTDTTITITDAGDYWIRTVDSVKCVEYDTINISLSTQNIEPNFLTANEICVKDTLYLFDVTRTDADNYSWSFDDGNISTEQHPSHIFENEGIYSINLSMDYADCIGKNITKTVKVISCEEETENLKKGKTNFDKFIAYPNPTNGDFTIEIELFEIADLEVYLYSVHGNIIYSSDFEMTDEVLESVSLSDLEKGFYFLQAISGEDIIQLKLLVH